MALNLYIFRRRWALWLGLIPRLLLIAFVVPNIATIWFVPFLEGWLKAPSLDPWTAHLAMGGTPLAFPYGPIMFLALLPGVAIGTALAALTGWAHASIAGFGLGLLAADLSCLALLASIKRRDLTLLWLWLSPAVILISYWHGQNDLVPVAFMLGSVLALRRNQALWSGFALGLAIAAKLSMVLTVPVLAIYLYRNARLRELFWPFIFGLSGPILLQLLVFAGSPGARLMVLGTPEARKVFQLALDLGGGLKIYLLPVIYLVVLFWTWRLRRMTYDLLLSVIGIVFLLVILLTPASPGWFIWAAPFLAIHATQTGPRGLVLVFGLSVMQALVTLLQFSGATIPLFGINFSTPMATVLGITDLHIISVVISAEFALGLFIAHRMWQEGVHRNELYRLSRRPLVIGIAGDSGAGKDSLALGLAGLFGERSVASIAGDDYHRWDRGKPMWSALTHLNPRANDLSRMTEDVIRLSSGHSVNARHYDHKTGRFTRPQNINFNDVILVSGLHALGISSLRDRYDVGVYLDMDEELRRYFKVRRDVSERGHSLDSVVKEIERRSEDTERFIRPQKKHADIVFSLQPENREQIHDALVDAKPRLKLAVLMRRSAFHDALTRALIGLCGMQVDIDLPEDSEVVQLIIEGDIRSEDIAIVAARIVPNIDELLALEPAWQHGTAGLMQLIVLSQAAHALRTSEAES